MSVHLDPQDPRCPECGGPISATATYCMHCYTEFETTDATSTESDVLGRVTDRSTTSADAGGLLAPDGLLDDSLTVTVGLVAGLVVSLLTLVTVLLLTRSLWSLLFVLAVWLGVSAYLVRQRTVNEAVRGGCYAVAFGLVALPTVTFSESMTGGDFVGRVFLFVVGEVLFGLVALVLVAVGYVVGKRARRSAM